MSRSCPIRLPRRENEARPLKSTVSLNVLVPLGGLSSNAFTEAGFRMPKPLVPIVGRPMILWMFDHLDLFEDDHIWIGVRRDVEAKFSLTEMLRREYPFKITVVCLDFDTRGATETLYCMLKAMDASALARRTIALNSDTLWFCDVLGGARALPENVGCSFYFNADEEGAPYSYIRIENTKIVEIKEKVAISRLANNGGYAFESADKALEGLESLLDEACVKSEDQQNYVSGLIDHMMQRGATFLAVRANDFASVGSPAKLRSFVARLRRGEIKGTRAMRFCFDLGTLVSQDKPLVKSIAIARELHDAGHTIIIYTDRGMDKGNVAKAMAQVGPKTFEQLHDFDIPCDEIIFGKPRADVYVDSRAVNPLFGDNFEDALGWDLVDTSNSDLDAGVKPRHFNSVRRVGDAHVEKTGPRNVMRGEIYWYQRMPADLADLFPHLRDVTEHPAQELSSVVMARVVGVTFSHLLVNSCVSPGRLGLLLSSLSRIHTQQHSNGSVSDDLICANYYAKVSGRYAKHRQFFDSFADDAVDIAQLATVVLAFLQQYQDAKRFKPAAYIHGDPVFSNVMLTTESRIMFLDMRGALGDTLTTAGDVYYDLSKVYQSLCGYDFIILDVDLTPHARAHLKRLRDDVFLPWLTDNHPDINIRDIRLLTAAHFFCIVPLHDNRQHQRHFLTMAADLLADDGLLERTRRD